MKKLLLSLLVIVSLFVTNWAAAAADLEEASREIRVGYDRTYQVR